MEDYSDLTDYQLKTLNDKLKEINRQKFLDNCKQRLLKLVSKKTNTIMIGSLAAFEDIFGFLWGCKQDRKLSKDEQKMKDLWESVRTRILDSGNNQIRAMQNEISNHIVSWNRYHIDFDIVS